MVVARQGRLVGLGYLSLANDVMATYLVSDPSGQKHKIQGPDGASPPGGDCSGPEDNSI